MGPRFLNVQLLFAKQVNSSFNRRRRFAKPGMISRRIYHDCEEQHQGLNSVSEHVSRVRFTVNLLKNKGFHSSVNNRPVEVDALITH